MYKARISITMNFDRPYFDLQDGRVMPPQMAAMIMYNSRTIENVSTALQWHKKTTKNTLESARCSSYLVKSLEKHQINKFLACIVKTISSFLLPRIDKVGNCMGICHMIFWNQFSTDTKCLTRFLTFSM